MQRSYLDTTTRVSSYVPRNRVNSPKVVRISRNMEIVRKDIQKLQREIEMSKSGAATNIAYDILEEMCVTLSDLSWKYNFAMEEMYETFYHENEPVYEDSRIYDL
jgi:N-acetyl-gamma-glutamylphosphate reductase